MHPGARSNCSRTERLPTFPCDSVSPCKSCATYTQGSARRIGSCQLRIMYSTSTLWFPTIRKFELWLLPQPLKLLSARADRLLEGFGLDVIYRSWLGACRTLRYRDGAGCTLQWKSVFTVYSMHGVWWGALSRDLRVALRLVAVVWVFGAYVRLRRALAFFCVGDTV